MGSLDAHALSREGSQTLVAVEKGAGFEELIPLVSALGGAGIYFA